MNGRYWQADDDRKIVFSIPLSSNVNGNGLCAVVRQDLNGPKYLGMFGLTEAPTTLKIHKFEANGEEATIWLDPGLADAVNFTKSVHLILRNMVGVDLAACDCLPVGVTPKAEPAKRNRHKAAMVVLFALAASVTTGSLLIDWSRKPMALPSPSVAEISVSPPVAPSNKQPSWSREKAEDEAERMRTTGTPDQILGLGRFLYDMGAGDLAAALFRTAGERGRPEGWLELARLYDPQVEVRNPHLTKEAKIAHFNYVRAARAGIGAAEAEAARLLTWLHQQAARGDASAVKTLQEIER